MHRRVSNICRRLLYRSSSALFARAAVGVDEFALVFCGRPYCVRQKRRDFCAKISPFWKRLIECQVFDESMHVAKREDFFEKIFPFLETH
jgi:hypothetical protein